MNTAVFKRDLYFFPLIFAVWSIFMLIRHSGFNFYDTPMPSAQDAVNLSDIIQNQGTIDLNIEELNRDLEKEVSVSEKGHILHNIGTAYYDQYRRTSKADLLDSAQFYYERSISTLGTVGRFYYNLGRLFTERREHMKAKIQYEQAINKDSQHVLAMHNLALLNYFELGNTAEAARLLKMALDIRASLPICSYILGEIALVENRPQDALRHFEREVEIFTSSADKQGIPASMSATRYAVTKSHRHLALLFSTKFPDRDAAQKNFHAYLSMETDPNERDAAISEMKRFWVIRTE